MAATTRATVLAHPFDPYLDDIEESRCCVKGQQMEQQVAARTRMLAGRLKARKLVAATRGYI